MELKITNNVVDISTISPMFKKNTRINHWKNLKQNTGGWRTHRAGRLPLLAMYTGQDTGARQPSLSQPNHRHLMAEAGAQREKKDAFARYIDSHVRPLKLVQEKLGLRLLSHHKVGRHSLLTSEALWLVLSRLLRGTFVGSSESLSWALRWSDLRGKSGRVSFVMETIVFQSFVS